jgi:FkbM family methyltransferase
MLDALAPGRPLGNFARRLGARRLNVEWLMWYGRTSYSAEGEDVLLNRNFYSQRRGFYVDLGAFHPVQASTTYLFYRRGWRGITVEPTPGVERLFRRKRPRDVHLPVAVGSGGGEVAFNLFQDGVYNCLSRVADRACSGARPIGAARVPIVSLASILIQHAPPEGIDFLSIDVEGAELDALQSNDWTRFRPKLICAEILDAPIADVAQHPVAKFLAGEGYRLFAKTGFSSFFAERGTRLYSESMH